MSWHTLHSHQTKQQRKPIASTFVGRMVQGSTKYRCTVKQKKRKLDTDLHWSCTAAATAEKINPGLNQGTLVGCQEAPFGGCINEPASERYSRWDLADNIRRKHTRVYRSIGIIQPSPVTDVAWRVTLGGNHCCHPGVCQKEN